MPWRTIEHSGIRGTDAVRFAEVAINGRKVRAAIVHGLGSAAKLLDQIQSGEAAGGPRRGHVLPAPAASEARASPTP